MAAANGAALSVFNDFMKGTGPAIDTGPDNVVIHIARNQTWMLHRMLKGRGPDSIFQGGTKLREQLIFDVVTTRRHYKPNATHLWSNPQVLEEWEIDWRFNIDHMSWTKQEIQLQVNRGMTRGARFQVYKRVRRQKLARLHISCAQGWEQDLFASPDFAEMESSSGYRPYSLACFVNQENPAGWSTLQGVTLADHPAWACQRVGTDLTANDGTAEWAGWAALDVAFQQSSYDKIPLAESDSDPRTTPNLIACSLWGFTMVMRNMRAANDRFVLHSSQDGAYMRPSHNGIPFERLAELDKADIWPDGSSGYAGEQGAAVEGPRFMGLQLGSIGPVYHSDCYLDMEDPMRHPLQPGTYVQPVDTWWNIRAQKLQNQFCVYPTANVTKPGYIPAA